ncbi:hypothetical protein KC678_00810 [Candidatus Dojkabacteria bacterium]|uniref:Sulfatase-modifying factor enzyme domain-containing protein n=1 Tax=Candidatus Dojkabacteria bacterium TaxID=2099670 RepID=A0A955I8D7_9BACT|nr:hypothetical protein [Candidatus Dojkabacteria bacterium]
MSKKNKKLLTGIQFFLVLIIFAKFSVFDVLTIKALNDVYYSFDYTSATSGNYTYLTGLMAVDDNGAHPAVDANKFTNPSFTSDNSSWSLEATPLDGWALVPGNGAYLTSDFLVMQYEAKYDCTADGDGDIAATCSAPADFDSGVDYRDLAGFDPDNVVSTANGGPIVHIRKTQAVNACPSGSHLITNNEWMTIARNIEVQPTNWADGTVGSTVSSSGGLKRGNDGASSSVGYNGANPEFGTGRDTKAMLTLSNGSQIWDLSGNVYEIVNFDANTNGTYNEAADLISPSEHPEATNGTTTRSGEGWSGFTSADTGAGGWYLENDGSGSINSSVFRPADTSLTALNGIGRIFHDSDSADTNKSQTLLRGGWYSDGANTGLYSLYLPWSANASYATMGYRCATSSTGVSQLYEAGVGQYSSGGNHVSIDSSVQNGKLTQSINVGDTSTYDLSAYVYDETIGNDGGTVDDTIAELYYNGSAIATSYEDQGSGWWKLSGSITGANESREYGIIAYSGKDVLVDDLTLLEQGEYSVFSTNSYTNTSVDSWDSFSSVENTSGSSTINYQICTDNGSNCELGNSWMYWDGDSWETALNTTTHTNTAAELDTTAMQALPIISTKISVKSIFSFIGEESPELDSIQIGLSGDGVPPMLNVNPLSANPTSNPMPSFNGVATDDIGTVASVEYQIDGTGGAWLSCLANDSAFDEVAENFTCNVSSTLTDGQHVIYFRATDSNDATTEMGSYSEIKFNVLINPTSNNNDTTGESVFIKLDTLVPEITIKKDLVKDDAFLVIITDNFPIQLENISIISSGAQILDKSCLMPDDYTIYCVIETDGQGSFIVTATDSSEQTAQTEYVITQDVVVDEPIVPVPETPAAPAQPNIPVTPNSTPPENNVTTQSDVTSTEISSSDSNSSQDQTNEFPDIDSSDDYGINSTTNEPQVSENNATKNPSLALILCGASIVTLALGIIFFLGKKQENPF